MKQKDLIFITEWLDSIDEDLSFQVVSAIESGNYNLSRYILDDYIEASTNLIEHPYNILTELQRTALVSKIKKCDKVLDVVIDYCVEEVNG